MLNGENERIEIPMIIIQKMLKARTNVMRSRTFANLVPLITHMQARAVKSDSRSLCEQDVHSFTSMTRAGRGIQGYSLKGGPLLISLYLSRSTSHQWAAPAMISSNTPSKR